MDIDAHGILGVTFFGVKGWEKGVQGGRGRYFLLPNLCQLCVLRIEGS